MNFSRNKDTKRPNTDLILSGNLCFTLCKNELIRHASQTCATNDLSYGIILSEATLLKGLRLDPCNFDLLYALFTFYIRQNNRTKAVHCIEKLKACFPDEKSVQHLYNDFINKR